MAHDTAVSESLVERARDGDHGAFEALAAAKLRHAYRTAGAILGNEADARDATQDALVAVWINLPRLRDTNRFDGWFHRILMNSCRDLQRARRQVREVQLDGAAVPITETLEATVTDHGLAKAFERLSIDERAILVAHHLEQLPLVEIALKLGIPVGTAKSRLHTARRALERALERER